MRLIYQEQKGGFSESKFEEDMEKYFDINLEKLEFLYQNIISSENKNIEPNISIINDVLALLENKDIGINEIKQYSKIQNINSQIKLIELNIINNLLLNLNCERNIIFLLYLVSKKIRNEYNKLNSFFENTYCSDYFIMEKLKYQFHLFLEVLSYKLIEIGDYSLFTKISLTESLLWNMKGRNFPVLIEIMKSFEEIKTSTINQDDDIFILEHEKIYNVKYFNKRKVIDIKFEVFQILVQQILNKIENILKMNDKNENKLIIERNPSNINKSDYEEIFKIIISYFIDIKVNCLYYFDLNLFFYKIFINSHIFQHFLLSSYPESISKIMNIALSTESFSNNNNNKIGEESYYENNKIILNRLIMLKLFSQIIEDIKDDELDDLSKCLKIFDKGNINIENPFIHLYNILSSSKLDNNKEEIISFYYNNLLLICLNNIYKIEKNETAINKLIENKLYSIIILLCKENSLYMAENNFILKYGNSYCFEEDALFYSENLKENQKGKIVCFLNSLLKEYLKNNNIGYFDKSSFIYKLKDIENGNKNKNILVIMQEIENSESFTIHDIEVKDKTKIAIIKKENNYQRYFIMNNKELILNIIKEEIQKDSLNEKGIYLILKLIFKLIEYINKQDLILIFEFIWKYYQKNKLEENNYIFMSLEFIEDILYENFTSLSLDHKDIYKKSEENNNLYSLFNYKIQDNNLKIYLKNSYTINNWKFEFTLTNSFKNEIFINDYYNEKFELTSISFFKFHENYIGQEINDNSFLLTQIIRNKNDLLELSEIIKSNKNKIKVIIASGICLNNSQIIDFINENGIPIYILNNQNYKTLIDFFIEGKANIIYLSKNKYYDLHKYFEDKEMAKENSNQINIYKFDFVVNEDENNIDNNPEENSNEKNKNKKKYEDFKENRNRLYKNIKNQLQIYKLLNIKLVKRLIYDILYLQSIKISELEKIFGDIENIIYIYEVLCMEYYFNIKYNLSNVLLKSKLRNYLLKMPLKENNNEKNNNKWLSCYIKNFAILNDNNNLNYENYLLNYDISKFNNEIKLLKIIFNKYNNIFYDKLLFLSKSFVDIKNKKDLIQIYFNALSKIIHNLIIEKQTNIDEYSDFIENDFEDERNNNYIETLFLLKIMNILYEYYFDINNFSLDINQYYEESIISSNFHNEMKILIEKKFNLNDYIYENNYDSDYDDDYYYYNTGRGRGRGRGRVRGRGRGRGRIRVRGRGRGRGRGREDKRISLLFQFIFTYFDFCLILFFRDKKIDILKYWINSENKLFKFYYDYKVLSIGKNYYKNDFKESFSLIAFYSGILNNFNKITNNSTFKMKINEINKYEVGNKLSTNNTYRLIFKNFSSDKNINKISIFCYENENNQKYILQDIIDINDIKRKNNIYKLRVNKDIFLIPRNNITTYLYTFQHSSNSFKNLLNYYYNYKNTFDYNNLLKIEDIPKYSWNLEFGSYKYLIQSEEDNKIYYFNSYNNEISKNSKFILDDKINQINTETNKIMLFIKGPEKSPPFLYSEKGDLFCIDDKKYKYRWLEDKERRSNDYPLKISIISNIKIISLCATNNECFIIDDKGILYENICYNHHDNLSQDIIDK